MVSAILTTIQAAAVLFPSFLPTWQERPFEYDDFDLGPRPVEMQADEIEWQMREGFKYADEPALHCQFVRELGRTEHPRAAELLLARLQVEEDPEVRATILRQLANLPTDAKTAMPIIAGFLNDENTSIRCAAIRLYATYQAAATAPLLAVLEDYDDNRTTRSVLTALLANGKTPAYASLQDIRDRREPGISAAAWRLSCRTDDAANSLPAFRDAAQNGPVVTRFGIAQEMGALPPEVRLELAASLRTDRDPAVRSRVAETLATDDADQGRRILAGLAGDRDYAVRAAALEALKNYVGDESTKIMASAIADPSRLVREKAAAGGAVLFRGLPGIADLIIPHCRSASAAVRYSAYRALGEMKSHEHSSAISSAVRRETVAANLIAGLDALLKMKAVEAAELFVVNAGHEDAAVRAAAVRALGILPAEAVHKLLVKSLEDPDMEVRYQAIVAMGRTSDPKAVGPILKVLKSLGPEAEFGTRHRAAACWAAARLPSVPDALLQRLRDHGTKRIVPTEMGNVSEGDLVLCSVAFALADIARDQAAAVPYAEAVISHLQGRPQPGMPVSSDFTASPATREMARQAAAWLQGETFEPAPRPTREVPLTYRRIKDR